MFWIEKRNYIVRGTKEILSLMDLVEMDISAEIDIEWLSIA